MATTLDSQNLELSVADFGPIDKAKIDLRPLTIFVGPSNTGKSYMAILIYALHQFFSAYSGGKGLRASSRMIQRQRFDWSENDISNLSAWAEETIADLETTKSEDPYSIELPEFVDSLVRPILNNVAHLRENLDNEIARCFGVDKTKNLVRYPSSNRAKISLCSNLLRDSVLGNVADEPGDNSSFKYEVIATEQEVNFDASISNIIPLRIEMNKNAQPPNPWWLMIHEMMWNKDDDVKKLIANELCTSIVQSVVSNIIDPLNRPAHYLPADRAGVMHAHQVAVRGLIASASRVALRRDSPMPVLSGVLGDFLEQLVALASSSPTRREPEGDNDLALRMEQALLQGIVRVERSEIDYPSFVYRPEGWEKDLPLMNASSMVSELAPVVLYLRHVVRPGDLLIIEEPESHLHPAMQVEFVRQLAVAVKSGIRILITTHSEWVLEELANLVRLSELPVERRKGIDDPDVALSPEEIGAWLFERGAKNSGSVVLEMPLDVESGTFSAGFGLITEGLYNRWAEISNRIEEG
ncbi:MAG: AAA family ATPase [Gemmatimonadetes bacterium]|nr:AAA family ATPase [Gemmatimonadota bacterium]